MVSYFSNKLGMSNANAWVVHRYYLHTHTYTVCITSTKFELNFYIFTLFTLKIKPR